MGKEETTPQTPKCEDCGCEMEEGSYQGFYWCTECNKEEPSPWKNFYDGTEYEGFYG